MWIPKYMKFAVVTFSSILYCNFLWDLEDKGMISLVEKLIFNPENFPYSLNIILISGMSFSANEEKSRMSLANNADFTYDAPILIPWIMLSVNICLDNGSIVKLNSRGESRNPCLVP